MFSFFTEYSKVCKGRSVFCEFKITASSRTLNQMVMAKKKRQQVKQRFLARKKKTKDCPCCCKIKYWKMSLDVEMGKKIATFNIVFGGARERTRESHNTG